MVKYWCPVCILVNLCLCSWIKNLVAVHYCQCALFITKLLQLLLPWFSKLIIFLYYTQRLDSCKYQLECIEEATVHHCSQTRSPPWYLQHLMSPDYPVPHPITMKSEDGNYPPPSVPSSVADISASTVNPATVSSPSPSPSPSDTLLPSRVEVTSVPAVIPPLTPPQVPLPPSVATSFRSAATLSGRAGLSVRASRQQKSRDNLVHLLSVASLTNSPLLVKAAVGCLSLISRILTSKRFELEAIFLPPGEMRMQAWGRYPSGKWSCN